MPTGRNTVGDALDATRIGTAFRKAMTDAGLGHKRDNLPRAERFTFHDLRHTFATLTARVWQPTELQAYMGHADLKTTQRYLHHVPRQRAAAEASAAIRAMLAEVGSELGNETPISDMPQAA